MGGFRSSKTSSKSTKFKSMGDAHKGGKPFQQERGGSRDKKLTRKKVGNY